MEELQQQQGSLEPVSQFYFKTIIPENDLLFMSSHQLDILYLNSSLGTKVDAFNFTFVVAGRENKIYCPRSDSK